MASKIQKLKDRAMHVLAGDIEDRSKAELLAISQELQAIAKAILYEAVGEDR